jgi:hypothetical protein
MIMLIFVFSATKCKKSELHWQGYLILYSWE